MDLPSKNSKKLRRQTCVKSESLHPQSLQLCSDGSTNVVIEGVGYRNYNGQYMCFPREDDFALHLNLGEYCY